MLLSYKVKPEADRLREPAWCAGTDSPVRLLQNLDHGDVTTSAMTVEVSSPTSDAARIQELLGEVASLQEDKVGARVLSCSQSLVREASRRPQDLQ